MVFTIHGMGIIKIPFMTTIFIQETGQYMRTIPNQIRQKRADSYKFPKLSPQIPKTWTNSDANNTMLLHCLPLASVLNNASKSWILFFKVLFSRLYLPSSASLLWSSRWRLAASAPELPLDSSARWRNITWISSSCSLCRSTNRRSAS